MFYKKFLFILIFLLLSKISYAEWSEWQGINSSQLKITIDPSIKDIVGDTNIDSWKSVGKLAGGKKAFQTWSEINTGEITLFIDHFKLPEGWVISNSEK